MEETTHEFTRAASISFPKEYDDDNLQSAAAMRRDVDEHIRQLEYLTLCTVVSWTLGRQSTSSLSAAKLEASNTPSLLTVQTADPEAQEKHQKKKVEALVNNVRRATIQEFFNGLNEKPQLVFLHDVANVNEMEQMSKSSELEGWHASSSLSTKMAPCIVMWSTDLAAPFHVKERYGFRRELNDKSLQEMFSLESIVAGGGSAPQEVSKKLEEKRLVFVLLQVWGNRSAFYILVGIYNGPKKFSEQRRIELFARFVQLAKQAARDVSGGNLIIASETNIGLEKTPIIEQIHYIREMASSVDAKLFEKPMVEGTTIISWISPDGSFTMERLRCRKIQRTIKKTLLKMNQDVQVEDDELKKYFAHQPVYLAMKIRKEHLDESRKSICPANHRLSDAAHLSEILAGILKQKQSDEKANEDGEDHGDTD